MGLGSEIFHIKILNCDKKVQGDHGSLTQDFVHFNSGFHPVCPFAMPSLPNFPPAQGILVRQWNK